MTTTPINFNWPTKDNIPELLDNEVHLWGASLNQPALRIETLAHLLHPDEAARAARFVFDKDRRHFIVGRAFLRQLLGQYLQISPQQVQFTYGPQGKPDLEPAQAKGLCFNLSHSGGGVLYGVTRNREIGVDIELPRQLDDLMQIARRFFSASEYEMLRNLPAAQHSQGFFNCWTRKEAYIKALSKGLSHPLDKFDVTLIPNQPACLVRDQIDPHALQRWWLTDLDPAPGYIAALVVEGHDLSVRCWHWP